MIDCHRPLRCLLCLAVPLLAVGARNIVHAVFGLGLCLCGVALAFLALGSPFVAAMEVLIYIGGITVAMVFAIMLSTIGRNEPRDGVTRRLLAAAAALAFFAAGFVLIRGMGAPPPPPDVTEAAWSVEQIGRDLLDRYNLAFEALSVVLLLAIIGAITIAARSEADPTADAASGEDAP